MTFMSLQMCSMHKTFSLQKYNLLVAFYFSIFDCKIQKFTILAILSVYFGDIKYSSIIVQPSPPPISRMRHLAKLKGTPLNKNSFPLS